MHIEFSQERLSTKITANSVDRKSVFFISKKMFILLNPTREKKECSQDQV